VVLEDGADGDPALRVHLAVGEELASAHALGEDPGTAPFGKEPDQGLVRRVAVEKPMPRFPNRAKV